MIRLGSRWFLILQACFCTIAAAQALGVHAPLEITAEKRFLLVGDAIQLRVTATLPDGTEADLTQLWVAIAAIFMGWVATIGAMVLGWALLGLKIGGVILLGFLVLRWIKKKTRDEEPA